MNNGWIYRNCVSPKTIGQTLLDFYTHRYWHSSREDWQHRIEVGQITVDGKPGYPHQPLCLGQQLAYHRPPWQEPDVPLAFSVLFEDEDVLAIAKPSGLPVLPGGGFLEHTLLHQLRLQFPNDALSPVHRLGRGTSGVMLVGRSPFAKSELSRQLREATKAPPGAARLAKTYRALIGPSDLPESFVMATPIGPVPYPVLGTVYAANSNGKTAYSEGQIIDRRATQTVLNVTIYTGRPHQIRIHLAAAGYPLLNDPLYAAGGVPYPVDLASGWLPTPGDGGYWLHAHQVRFEHPRTRSPMEVICPPPPILQIN